MIKLRTRDKSLVRRRLHRPRRWLAFAVLASLVALYSVQLAASVHLPNHGQPHQKWQVDRDAATDLLLPAAPLMPGPRLAFRLRLRCTAARRPSFFFRSTPRCRAPPRHSREA